MYVNINVTNTNSDRVSAVRLSINYVYLFILLINLYKNIYKIMFTQNLAMNINAFEGLIWLCDASAYLLPIILT